MSYPDKAERWLRIAASFVLLIIAALTTAVTLEWDPSPDAWVTGYAIHYGTASSNYTVRVDVGNQTTCTISNLTPGVTYYFVATAYTADGQESLPSNEVAYTVPIPDLTNAPPRVPVPPGMRGIVAPVDSEHGM